jgi:hypothetical protein
VPLRPEDVVQARLNDEILATIAAKIAEPWIGCKEGCFACGAPCLFTIPGHEEQHMTRYHRLPAVNGVTIIDSKILCNDFNCNGIVYHNETFTENYKTDKEIRYDFSKYHEHHPRW